MSLKIMLATALLAALPARAETLTASWYGGRFEGRTTSAGCTFHAAGLSAASRTLPLGTVLEVSREGRSVILTVDDRGPYVVGRSLDLSYGAAKRLGMVSAGVSRVGVRILGHRPLHC